jgi:hypothetical protein
MASMPHALRSPNAGGEIAVAMIRIALAERFIP